MKVQHKKPALLVLASTVPRWQGDHEPRFVLDLCRRMTAEYEVLLLAPHAPGALMDEILEGVRVRRYRYGFPGWECLAYQGGMLARIRENPWRALLLPIFFLAQIEATVRLIREIRPQIIHAHWLIPQGWVALVARRLSGVRVPILCTSHGGDLFSLRASPFRWLKRQIIFHVDGLTVVSRAMAEEVEHLAPGVTAQVIPMGTDLTDTFVPPEDEAARNPLQIVFVGRLVEKKGIPILLRAFRSVLDALPQARLIIAGDGPLRAELAAEARSLKLGDTVDFRGALRNDQLPTLYQASALAVFPFIVASGGDQEGFPLVVVEAMGCACPVITSDLPAVRDTVTHNETGLLFPAGDSSALATAMIRLLQGPEIRNRLARAGLERVRDRVDWKATATQHLALMRSIMDAGLPEQP